MTPHHTRSRVELPLNARWCGSCSQSVAGQVSNCRPEQERDSCASGWLAPIASLVLDFGHNNNRNKTGGIFFSFSPQCRILSLLVSCRSVPQRNVFLSLTTAPPSRPTYRQLPGLGVEQVDEAGQLQRGRGVSCSLDRWKNRKRTNSFSLSVASR